MIQIIAGKKGSGKTKRLIDMTNQAAKESAGDVIFIEDDNSHMFDIDHKVRFVNAGEYGVGGVENFTGFVCGMLSQNADISTIFIDGFARLVKCDLVETAPFFKQAEALSAKLNVNFVLSVSVEPADLPDIARPYIL